MSLLAKLNLLLEWGSEVEVVRRSSGEELAASLFLMSSAAFWLDVIVEAHSPEHFR